MRFLMMVLLFGLCWPAGAPVWADEPLRSRHALVIGIGDYQSAGDLANAAHDADDIAALLSALGFTLHGGQALVDPMGARIEVEVRAFARDLPDGAMALVYLAGHGLADRGTSYLIPADDGAISSRADLAGHGFALVRLTARLAARNGVDSLVLFDACRANPLTGQGQLDARSDLVAPAQGGSMSLIYAAAPGQTASDGAQGARNSPFAAALLGALRHAEDGPPLTPHGLLLAISQTLRASAEPAGTSTGAGMGQTPWLAQALSGPEPIILP